MCALYNTYKYIFLIVDIDTNTSNISTLMNNLILHT